MQLKYPRELTAQDLPLIESPFFAADRVRSILSSFYSHERARLKLPGQLVNYSHSGALRTDSLCAQVAAGELLLVYSESERSQLFSPVVTWQPDHSANGQGQWVLQENPMSCFGVGSAVDALNRNGLTPRDLRSAMGIGGARAGHIDSEIRRERLEQDRTIKPKEPSLIGVSSSATGTLVPAAAQATVDVEPKRQITSEVSPLEIVVGLFMDGTLNNVNNIREFEREVEEQCLAPMREDLSKRAECEEQLRLLMGESYASAPTNVAKLWQLYDDSGNQGSDEGPIILKIYSPGAGTSTGDKDSIIGMATGLGETGVPRQVKQLFMDLASRIRNIGDRDSEYRIVFDLFGFSRGSAAARHAVNEILKGEEGMLSAALRHNNLVWPHSIDIRFVGLFDTVAGIVNFSDLDFSPGNKRTSPVNLHLSAKDVGKAVHLVAAHEKRTNFSLNSLKDANNELPDNFLEISMPGAHSDVGGGYPDQQIEDVLLYPHLSIRGDRVDRPEASMEWDNLAEMRDLLLSEGWLGKDSLPLPNGEQPSLKIHQRHIEHPVPDGQVVLSLKMKRLIKGEYSAIAMKIMYDLALEEGVPFMSLENIDGSNHLSEELQKVYEAFVKQLESGALTLSLDPTTQKRILQRYIHHSDHYNLMKTVVGDEAISVEFPFDALHPFRPTTERIRVVHPNNRAEASNAGRS